MDVKLDYITIQTMDSEKMKDFYVRYFEAVIDGRFGLTDNYAEAAEENAGHIPVNIVYTLSFKGGLKIKLIPKEPETTSFSPSIPVCPVHSVRLTFRVGSRRRVNELTGQMILEGNEVISEPGMSGPSHYSSRVFDPEGNIIELVA